MEDLVTISTVYPEEDIRLTNKDGKLKVSGFSESDNYQYVAQDEKGIFYVVNASVGPGKHKFQLNVLNPRVFTGTSDNLSKAERVEIYKTTAFSSFIGVAFKQGDIDINLDTPRGYVTINNRKAGTAERRTLTELYPFPNRSSRGENNLI